MIVEHFLCFTYYIRSFFLTYICVSLSAIIQMPSRGSFIRCECLTFATTTILFTISAPRTDVTKPDTIWLYASRLLNVLNCLFVRNNLSPKQNKKEGARLLSRADILLGMATGSTPITKNVLKLSLSNVAF